MQKDSNTSPQNHLHKPYWKRYISVNLTDIMIVDVVFVVVVAMMQQLKKGKETSEVTEGKSSRMRWGR